MVPTENRNRASTLAIPAWFIMLALLLIGLRLYAKLTQTQAPAGSGIAWLTAEEYDKEKNSTAQKDKELILYEFTADWCGPCKKRERTTFRTPAIIKDINNNFIPVRVDLTTEIAQNKPAVKKLTEEFDVDSVPLCVITLKSGEFVANDHWLFSTEFSDFLKNSKEEAENVRAEIMLAQGDTLGAYNHLSPTLKEMKEAICWTNESEYVMYHHLLCQLNRQTEIEPLMEKACAKTDENRDSTDPYYSKWLAKMNSYLRGQISESTLLEANRYDMDKAACQLAIGLKALRAGEKSKAIKALHQSAILSAKGYHSDKLAELLIKELDK